MRHFLFHAEMYIIPGLLGTAFTKYRVTAIFGWSGNERYGLSPSWAVSSLVFLISGRIFSSHHFLRSWLVRQCPPGGFLVARTFCTRISVRRQKMDTNLVWCLMEMSFA